MSVRTVITAQPGFEYLAASRRHGLMLAAPVIGWTVAIGDNGGVDSLRPVTACVVSEDPEMSYAVRWPDGRVYTLWAGATDSVQADWIFGSVAEWLFAVRKRACTHQLEESMRPC
jgi:hypothetical protein